MRQTFAADSNVTNYQPLDTVGFGEVSIIDGTVFASLSNGHVVLPVVLSNTDGDNLVADRVGEFMWARIRCVALACICIGAVGSTEEVFANERLHRIRALPPYVDGSIKGAAVTGSCALVEANGKVFTVSLYLICDRLRPIETSPDTGSRVVVSLPSFQSLDECLRSHSAGEGSMAVLGLLSRGMFKVAKVKENEYAGFMMTKMVNRIQLECKK